MAGPVSFPGWLSEVDVVDAHVHIIDRLLLNYDVVEFKTVPALARDWDEGMYRAELLAGEGSPELTVSAAVFVEVSAADDSLAAEVRWVESFVAAPSSLFAATVASVPVEQGAAATAAALDALNDCSVRGVRRLIQDRPQGFCTSDAFVAGVREVARRGLPFELCLRGGSRPDQCADVLHLVRSVPEGTFILDHIGKPDIQGRRLDPWRAFITELAACPNCYCKISGVTTEADPTAWTVEDLRPFVTHALHSFGYERCLFGSDWFVCTLASPVKRWVAALCDIVDGDGASMEQKRALFGRTARKLYRLPN